MMTTVEAMYDFGYDPELPDMDPQQWRNNDLFVGEVLAEHPAEAVQAPWRATPERTLVWNGLTAAHRTYPSVPPDRHGAAADPYVRPQNWQEYDEMVSDEDVTLVLLPRFR